MDPTVSLEMQRRRRILRHAIAYINVTWMLKYLSFLELVTCLCVIRLAGHGLEGPAVLICAAGDIHGAIDRFYDDVLASEISLGANFDWVLHVGDFGIWPDPERIDRATRNHDGAGDFSEWLVGPQVAILPM